MSGYCGLKGRKSANVSRKKKKKIERVKEFKFGFAKR